MSNAIFGGKFTTIYDNCQILFYIFSSKSQNLTFPPKFDITMQIGCFMTILATESQSE